MIKSLLQRFRKIISYLENPDIPFVYFILSLLFWITLRNFLEIFSDKAVVSFKLFTELHPLYYLAYKGLVVSYLHYYLSWVSVILCIGLLAFLFTKESLGKIFRVAFSFSFILNITPLVDLIITKGVGANIAYIYPSTLRQIFPLPVKMTAGMNVTFATTLILFFVYCFLKTNRIIKSLLATLTVHVTLSLFGAMALFLKATTPLPLIRIFTLIIFAEVLVVFFIQKPSFFKALLKDVRPFRILHSELMFVLGIFLASPGFCIFLQKELLSFVLVLVAIFLAGLTAIIINNLADYKIDLISNPDRPLVAEVIPREFYKQLAVYVFFLAMLCAAAVNFSTLFFILLCIGNYFIYSVFPFRLKRVPVFSKLFVSFTSLLLVMLGYIFAGQELLTFPSIIIWYFLTLFTLCANFIDLKDYEGDKGAGILTLPVIMGPIIAKLVIGSFFLIAYGSLSLVFLDLRLLLPGLVIGGVQFVLINKKHYQEKWVFSVHLAAIIALLFYLYQIY
ncbi:MAG: UbiA family prenyltransferase [Candidatus Omnitrophota bacterium]|nr:MAG: UbiA family prenyltransferase [Candidatus Omnitrophota bacterium]